MTHRRLNYLLLSIISALILVLILSHTVRAESEIAWNAGGFITGNFANNAGYSPGIGILAEGQVRWKFLEVKLGASTAWQKKKRASFGYTWGINSQLRGYFWKDFYVLGAYSFAGYKSTFKNGAIWEKNGNNLGFGIGWHPEYADINLTYYLQENSSPNNVQYVALSTRYQIWKYLWAMGNVKRMTFDQIWDGTLERWSAWTYTLGLGVRW